MGKLVSGGACMGQCWRTMWSEERQNWCRLPIPSPQALLGLTVLPTAPEFVSERTRCQKDLEMNWCFSRVGEQGAGSHRGG